MVQLDTSRMWISLQPAEITQKVCDPAMRSDRLN
jgi:hypothetical protein